MISGGRVAVYLLPLFLGVCLAGCGQTEERVDQEAAAPALVTQEAGVDAFNPEPVAEPGSGAGLPASGPAPLEDEPHSHEEHEKPHDHEGHDHGEDAHAGGTAHVHGIAELALVEESGRLTAEMMTPLANFGLSEADAVFSAEVIEALPGMLVLEGGGCTGEPPVARIDTSSGHTDAHILFSWTCEQTASVAELRFTGFERFPGFERVNAVFIGANDQKAAELRPSAAGFSLR